MVSITSDGTASVCRTAKILSFYTKKKKLSSQFVLIGKFETKLRCGSKAFDHHSLYLLSFKNWEYSFKMNEQVKKQNLNSQHTWSQDLLSHKNKGKRIDQANLIKEELEMNCYWWATSHRCQWRQLVQIALSTIRSTRVQI